MIEKSFDRKKMDVKLEEVIDQINACWELRQTVLLPPTILLSTVAKGEDGVLQIPKCYFHKLTYWIISPTKTKPQITVTISDRETNSTSTKTMILKDDFGEVIIDAKIPNQVLIECSTLDDVKISLCLIIYINDKKMWIRDRSSLRKLAELGEEL